MRGRWLVRCWVLTVALAVPTAAQATWTSIGVVSDPMASSDAFPIGTDGSGDTFFVLYRISGQLSEPQARVREASGGLSDIQTLQSGSNQLPALGAVNAAGQSAFGWLHWDSSHWRLKCSLRSGAGVLGPVVNLSVAGQDAHEPAIGIDGSGGALLAWAGMDGVRLRIEARACSGAGAAQFLSPAGVNGYGAHVGIDGAGNATVVWVIRQQLTNKFRVQFRVRSPGGSLGPIESVSAAGSDASDQAVAVASDGRAAFAWDIASPTGFRVQIRMRSASGTLGPIQTITGSDRSSGGPQVALDAQGNAYIVWVSLVAENYVVQWRERLADGSLTPVRNLSWLGGNADGATVSVNASGEAVFGWSRFGSADNRRAQVRVRSAAGVLGPITTLSSPGVQASAARGAVAPDGTAVVGWGESAAGTWHGYAVVGP